MAHAPQPDSGAARGPGRPRQDEAAAAEVRERLLDAATQLTIEQGFDGCGLREIAARAEVSPGMISYYFGDRQGLYEAMLARGLERMHGRVTELMERQDAEETDALEGLLRLQVESMAAEPWLLRLLLREVLVSTDSDTRDRVGKIIGAGPIHAVNDWLEAAKAKGLLREDLDTRLTALTLGSIAAFPMLIVPTLGEYIGFEIDDDFTSRLIEHNLELLRHGIRARPEDPT